MHQAGRKFGYIITSAFLPLLDDILDGGVDVLIGVDPEEGKGTALPAIKEALPQAGRALWGGVSGAVTVELGTEERDRGGRAPGPGGAGRRRRIHPLAGGQRARGHRERLAQHPGVHRGLEEVSH